MTGSLTATERSQLLGLARRAVEAAVRRSQVPAGDGEAIFDREAGAFVTLTCGQALRGCIGRIEPRRLGEVVVHCARAAALEDPRFPPVGEADLSDIAIEISVLTTPMRIDDLSAVIIGRHGVIVQQGARRGLLLPQVATEWGWTRDELLSHTCRKAGLPSDAWRGVAEVFTFEAEIFHETAERR